MVLTLSFAFATHDQTITIPIPYFIRETCHRQFHPKNFTFYPIQTCVPTANRLVIYHMDPSLLEAIPNHARRVSLLQASLPRM
ncbi:hypothetical protein Hanom_Chr14g01274241 [Helianthus anomalus]